MCDTNVTCSYDHCPLPRCLRCKYQIVDPGQTVCFSCSQSHEACELCQDDEFVKLRDTGQHICDRCMRRKDIVKMCPECMQIAHITDPSGICDGCLLAVRYANETVEPTYNTCRVCKIGYFPQTTQLQDGVCHTCRKQCTSCGDYFDRKKLPFSESANEYVCDNCTMVKCSSKDCDNTIAKSVAKINHGQCDNCYVSKGWDYTCKNCKSKFSEDLMNDDLEYCISCSPTLSTVRKGSEDIVFCQECFDPISIHQANRLCFDCENIEEKRILQEEGFVTPCPFCAKPMSDHDLICRWCAKANAEEDEKIKTGWQ